MKEKNYRAYFFTNMYLSSIQNGIQSAHTLHEMFIKYGIPSDKKLAMLDWAMDDKIIIVLNGGYSSNLEEIDQVFKDAEALGECGHPFASFRESDDALGGALTCVGIVLPEYIWSVKGFDQSLTEPSINNVDRWLYENLANYRLAN